MRAIVADLESRGRQPSGDPSLAGGTAGLAILHGYLAQTGPGPESAALACRCLQHATAAVAEQPGSASLYSGLTGVGWAIAHLRGRLPGLDGEDDLAEIDEVLLDHLDQSPWPATYDLIEGLVGFGVYALERLPRPAAVACLERVVDRLAETAEPRPEGITWWTDPAWLPRRDPREFPHGYYNLGLAHGVPGVIALLGQACAAGVAQDKARPLLDGAVRWLLAQQVRTGFPTGSARSAPRAGAAGLVLRRSGRRRGAARGGPLRRGTGLGAAALAIARRAAERPAEQAGVWTPALCHGAAGLGHLFNRMFQATGEPELAEAARFWFERTLAMRRPGRGIGGYEAWQPDDGRQAGPGSADPGLLTGAAGIALALLAATTADRAGLGPHAAGGDPARGTEPRDAGGDR